MASISETIPPTTSARQQYRANVFFQDGLPLTITLCALLYFILATSLDAAGHVREGLGILIPVTAGALLVGGLMSFSRFDSFFAFSHSMFAGLAWIIFLMARDLQIDDFQNIVDRGVPELQARAYTVLLRLLGWLDAAVNNKASADNFVFVFQIALLIWWLTYLGIWAVVRHGYTWRAVIPAASVLLINTYYAPKPVLAFLVVFGLIALILLIRTNLAEKQRLWREQRFYFSQDITWDFMRNGVVYALMVLALAVIVPDLGRNPTLRGWLEPVTKRYMEAQQELRNVYGGLNQRQSTVAQGFANELNLGGSRKESDEFIFQVQSDGVHPWRARFYDFYNGRGWRTTDEKSASFIPGEYIPVPSWNARREVSQTVTVLSAMGTMVIGAPDIYWSDLPLSAGIGNSPQFPVIKSKPLEDTESGSVELSVTNTNLDLDRGDRYTVISYVPDPSIDALRVSGTDYPQSIADKYLQLPENFSQKVRDEAIRIAGSMNTPYDMALALQNELRKLPYDSSIPAPGADVDPIEYFLFDLKRGYCDYYATSMATMLRSLGVPARVAVGFAAGVADEENPGIYFIRQRDAHAWVEVFFPGYGWLKFEPTSNQTPPQLRENDVDLTQTDLQDSARNEDRSNAAPTIDPLLGNNQPFEDPALPIPFDEQGQQAIPWWGWLLITPVLLALGLWGLWRMQTSGPSTFTPEFAPVLYERMQRWAGRIRLGQPPHFTPYEQAQRLSKGLPSSTHKPIKTVTQSYVDYQFAPPNARNNDPLQVVDEKNRLSEAWNTLLPMFIKTWINQRMNRRASTINGNGNGNNNGHFELDATVRAQPKRMIKRK